MLEQTTKSQTSAEDHRREKVKLLKKIGELKESLKQAGEHEKVQSTLKIILS